MVGVRTGDCFPTRAEELFLQAALLPDARAVEAWRTLRPEFDLDRVGGVIHTLVPMLYASLQAHGVDDPVMGRLKGQYRFFWLRNQLQMARGAKAIDALQRHGIPVILLKGAAMAAAYLDDPTVRPMSDIDVLVPTERLHDALLALRQGGWTPHPQMSDRMIAEDIARWSPSWDFRDSTATSVDLHWHVMHLSMQPDADADFWAASQETGFGGRCVRTLCAADHVLHSLSHGMSWQEGAIRWVPDSLMVLRKAGETFDWLRLIEQAEKRRLIEFVRAGIDYLHREFAAPVPDDVLNRMRRIRTPWLDRIEFRARARRTSDGDWTARVAQAVAAARRRRPLGALPSLRADLRRLGSAFGLPDDAR
ncbi:MAG: nucleotidyltransferase family protein, partial [Alphaproteobacteria bacterium]